VGGGQLGKRSRRSEGRGLRGRRSGEVERVCALQSYANILLGLTFVLYGLAMALGTAYPRWLGWVAAGSGVAWIVHGLIVPYVGLFDSPPRGVALILMTVWAFGTAYAMWRKSNGGRIARPRRLRGNLQNP
jgi:hypothetical protein